MTLQAEAIALLSEAKKHIMDWWRPEGELPPAKSYELVERIEALIATTSIEQAEPIKDSGQKPYAYEFWDGDAKNGRDASFVVLSQYDPFTGKPDYQGHIWKSMPLYTAPQDTKKE